MKLEDLNNEQRHRNKHITIKMTVSAYWGETLLQTTFEGTEQACREWLKWKAEDVRLKPKGREDYE